jgi:hypothetical protein
MPNRSSKQQARDPNVIRALDKKIRGGEVPAKDPLAVELGRRGGLKGGKARAEKLSPSKRAQIARKAAQARWKAKP